MSLHHIAADISPLREYPNFRRLWAGQTVSMLGNQLTQTAVPIQVFSITHSSFDVGMVGLAALIPLIGLGLLGGSIADAVDRRRLGMLTSALMAGCSAMLMVQAALRLDDLWLLYVLIGVQAGLSGIDGPARNAIIPRLLPPEKLPAGNALSALSMNTGLTGGPLLAGLLISTVGYFAAYLIDAVSFAAAFYALVRLPAMPPMGGGHRAGVASVLEGLRYLRRKPVVLMSFLVDIDAMTFGMPRALFPALAVSFFHGGAGTAGLLYAAVPMGALVAAAGSGWLGRVGRQGLAVIISIAVWGAAIIGFGFARTLWLGLLLLAVAGAADMVSAVFRNTILQVATPDEMRGRLSGVFLVVVAGGPRLGDVESGSVASAFSPFVSVVSGGIACLAGLAALVAAVPAFARYDARPTQDPMPTGSVDPITATTAPEG